MVIESATQSATEMRAERVADRRRAKRKELLLLQLTRSPQLGSVKTRMQPHLSAAQACELHSELTRWTCRQLLDSGLGAVEMAVAGDRQHALFDDCRSMGVSRIVRQRGADLGQRMYNALRCGLARYANVILVGSDCPGIDAVYLRQARDALRETQLVLGPASDGGYVLMGARAIVPEIFEDITWGSEQVFTQTVTALQRQGIRWAELPVKADIDRPDDLPIWEALQRKHQANTAPV